MVSCITHSSTWQYDQLFNFSRRYSRQPSFTCILLLKFVKVSVILYNWLLLGVKNILSHAHKIGSWYHLHTYKHPPVFLIIWESPPPGILPSTYIRSQVRIVCWIIFLFRDLLLLSMWWKSPSFLGGTDQSKQQRRESFIYTFIQCTRMKRANATLEGKPV